MNQAIERIESVKAGVVGASATTAIHACTAVLLFKLTSDVASTSSPLISLTALSTPSILVVTTVSLAIAAFSGFLFGVTYRYIIRQDSNTHLKQGAILAFGFVRAFAQLEPTLTLLQFDWLWDGLVFLDSFLMFGLAAIALEVAIRQKWLKSFNG